MGVSLRSLQNLSTFMASPKSKFISSNCAISDSNRGETVAILLNGVFDEGDCTKDRESLPTFASTIHYTIKNDEA